MMTHQWTNALKALGFGLITLAGTATAQTKDIPGPIDSLQDLQDTGRMLFKLVDENNDGQISQKEAIDAGNLSRLAGSSRTRRQQRWRGLAGRSEAGPRLVPGAEADGPVPDRTGEVRQAQPECGLAESGDRVHGPG